MRSIDKIRDEMAKYHDNPEICAVGDIVTRLLQADPAAETAVAAEGKTLHGAYQAMLNHARANKKGGSYCMPPDEAERIIRAYFGIPTAPNTDAVPVGVLSATALAPRPPLPASVPTPAPDPFDLDALLGEV